eukprot:3627-Chlamydomonas_euryale.AAC.5
MDGWMDGWMGVRMDGCMNGCTCMLCGPQGCEALAPHPTRTTFVKTGTKHRNMQPTPAYYLNLFINPFLTGMTMHSAMHLRTA